jgi:hypothetical protein
MNRFLAVFALAAGLLGCPGQQAEGWDPARVPPEVRDDYILFSQRCSKCHSLARPLQSGIEDDLFWEYYVARMRRMPGSGISPDDEKRILNFLRYYSAEQRKKRTGLTNTTWGTL